MEFKELTVDDFKINSDDSEATEYACKNLKCYSPVEYDIVYYKGVTFGIKYFSLIYITSKNIYSISADTLEEAIYKINQKRKKLINAIMEVPNAKSD